MNAWVYLVKATNSGGLHKIGKTENIERRMKELKVLPIDRICVIELPSIDVMDCAEKVLHQRFKAFRVPQSEMFNLSPEHLEDCKERMVAIEKRFAVPPPLTAEQKQAKTAKAIEALQQAEEEVRRQDVAEAVEKARKAHLEWLDEEAEAKERKRRLDETLKCRLQGRMKDLKVLPVARKLEKKQRKLHFSNFICDFSIFGLTACLLATTGIPLTPVLVGGLFAVVLYRVVRWVRS